MHPYQDASGQNLRLFSSLQHRKPAPGLAFQPGTRRPRRRLAPKGQHVKISFPPDPARQPKAQHPSVRLRQPLEQPRPLSEAERTQNYWAQNGTRRLTPAQLSRIDHKSRHAAHADQRAKRNVAAAAERARRRSARWSSQILGRGDA